MYTVVDLKLPDGIGLKIADDLHVNFFTSTAPSNPSRRLVVDCEYTSWSAIPVIDYLVGEKVEVRRSVLGVRICKGSPDYSGWVKRVDRTNIAKILDDRRKERDGARSIFSDIIRSSNLCQEIVLPGGTHVVGERGQPDRDLLWRELADAANRETSRILGTGTLGLRSLYYQRAGRRTFLDMPTAMDFDGDSFSYHQRSARSEPSPRYVDNQDQIAETGIESLFQAVAELTAGERGTPPATRGPRPRNQRW